MGRGLSGDFRKVEKWMSRLQTAGDQIRTRVARNMADEALTLVADGFKRESDPYGKAWAALKERQGRILQDTGRMRASWHRVQVSKAGFKIAAATDYAKFHQGGTSRMVARKMVPSGGQLPASWRRAMTEAADEAIKAHFR